MCHVSCVLFVGSHLTPRDVKGKSVLEVGSYDVNGGVRSLLNNWEPGEYIGVDIDEGPGVDIVCDASHLVNRFGKNRFDIVLSTEMLEHVPDWRAVVSNIKNVCKPGGLIVLTTRSYGFKYHGHPNDHWRYEVDDFKEIFSDLEILVLNSDFQHPGVFLKARKPEDLSEKNLNDIELYNIVLGRKSPAASDGDFRSWNFLRLSVAWKLIDMLRPVTNWPTKVLTRFTI